MTNPDNAAAFSRFFAELLADQPSFLESPAPAPADGDKQADDLADLMAEIKADTERNHR